MSHKRLTQLQRIAEMKRDIELGRLARLAMAREGLTQERQRLQDLTRQAARDGQTSLPGAGAAALFAFLTENRDGQIALEQARLEAEIARGKALAATAFGRASVLEKLSREARTAEKPPRPTET